MDERLLLDCDPLDGIPADWLCDELLLDELELLDDWLDDCDDELLDELELELELEELLLDGLGIDGGLGMLVGTWVGSDGVGIDDEFRQPVPIKRQPAAMNVSRVSVRLARMLASS